MSVLSSFLGLNPTISFKRKTPSGVSATPTQPTPKAAPPKPAPAPPATTPAATSPLTSSTPTLNPTPSSSKRKATSDLQTLSRLLSSTASSASLPSYAAHKRRRTAPPQPAAPQRSSAATSSRTPDAPHTTNYFYPSPSVPNTASTSPSPANALPNTSSAAAAASTSASSQSPLSSGFRICESCNAGYLRLSQLDWTHGIYLCSNSSVSALCGFVGFVVCAALRLRFLPSPVWLDITHQKTPQRVVAPFF